jgi:hypothetical protein
MLSIINKQSEGLRWAIQIIFVLFSIPAFFVGIGFHHLFFGIFPNLYEFVEPLVSDLNNTLFFRIIVVPQIFFLWWYYILSIYSHYWFDKGRIFESSLLKSNRLRVLLLQILIFLVFLDNKMSTNAQFLFMLYMPLVSITLTWWLSEMLCRFFIWRSSRRVKID